MEMANMTDTLTNSFECNGYVVIPGLLSPEEVHMYQTGLKEISGLDDIDSQVPAIRNRGWTDPDGVTERPFFWPLIFHEKLTSTLRQLMGPDVRYTQHSDLHVHHGAVGWHRDCANRIFRVGADWDESESQYRIVRVAIYLQTYAESGFALGVIPGSHRTEKLFTRFEQRVWNTMGRFSRIRGMLPPLWTAKKHWIKTEPGDCIIFDQRLVHSGSHIRGPKYAIFLSYGVDNEHSRRHRRYYLFARPDLHYKDYSPELVEHLKKANLYLAC